MIQAYSRTNRIADMQNKPWGNIVNYRWPSLNETLLNKALAVYANKDSANMSKEERKQQNEEDGIIARSFKAAHEEVKKVVRRLRTITNQFESVPPSEKKKCCSCYGSIIAVWQN